MPQYLDLSFLRFTGRDFWAFPRTEKDNPESKVLPNVQDNICKQLGKQCSPAQEQKACSTEDIIKTTQHAGRYSSGTCDLCMDGVVWIKTPEGAK